MYVNKLNMTLYIANLKRYLQLISEVMQPENAILSESGSMNTKRYFVSILYMRIHLLLGITNMIIYMPIVLRTGPPQEKMEHMSASEEWGRMETKSIF